MSLTKILKILDVVTGSDTRRSKNGTTFKPATKGRVIIQKPGQPAAIGHARKPKRSR